MTYITSLLRVGYIKLLNTHNSSQVQRQYQNEYIPLQLKLKNDPPSVIMNRIYLGDAYNAADYNILKKYKFNIIINASEYVPNYYENEFRYIKYNIKDTPDESISEILLHAYKILISNEYNIIFIHCLTGNSQGAAIALFYLTQKYHMTVYDANKYLLQCRKTVNINQNYIDDIAFKNSF